ncbi:MAG: CYTH domain-containing protein [Blautia sp.]|nr:CYTH domain-containing protein [Blautia sp.]
MEIEKKFLIAKLPEHLEQYPGRQITQGYLCTAPVVRIRRADQAYILTCKGEGLMVREEYELPLSAEAFAHLAQKIDGRMIEKTRYLIPLSDGLTAELDVFHGDLAPLTLVEVEFASVEDARSFVPPEWFGEDVTEDGRYHNSRLSQVSVT